jgi:lysyl-tRNA synthetase class 2
MELNEIIQQRKAKLEALSAKGIELYPSVMPAHIDISQALSDFQEGGKIALCGRLTARRQHGKVTFMDLRDTTGRIQLYFKADVLGTDAFELLSDLDIADFIAVSGELFKTQTGEPTVKVEKFSVLAKALRPLPEKWHGLKDVDLRYRQRYLDLIANEEVKKVFLARSRIIQAIRNFLDNKGFLEVETPMMHNIPGGAAGRPFKTHHNEYHIDLYLRIAPELYLKQLLVGGLERVYEINRSYRNEGVSQKHNPEFTMLEVYQAYANYLDMMQIAQDLIITAAKEVLGNTKFTYQGKGVDLALPWQRISFAEMVKKKFDISPGDEAGVMLKKLHAKGFAKEAAKLTRSQVAKVIEDILEQEMGSNPVFVTDYFTNLCPLAKTRKDNPLISERFELYIAGLEIGNAYTELNDPLEQRKRFEEEIKELSPEEKKNVDEDYVLALEHGMPPAGGLGIGVDRLIMLLTDQPSIRDVILFPLLRPEKGTVPK